MKAVALMAAFAVPMAVGWLTVPGDGVVPNQDHQEICEGGSESPIDVSFEIMAVDSSKFGESLSIHAEIHNHFEAAAQALLVHEILDDRGNSIQEPTKVEVGLIEAGNIEVLALRTPPDLKPGFYELRVTAAGLESKTNDDSIAIQSLFFSIGREGILPVTHDDFLVKSNAGLAFVDTDVEETK